MRLKIFATISFIILGYAFAGTIESFETSSQLRKYLTEPHRGLGEMAERSYQQCQDQLKRLAIPPANANNRTVSFILKAKNKRYAQGGFFGPGAACIAVRHEYRPGQIYGYFLAVYRGGTELEFPGLNKIVGVGFQNIGDVGSLRTIRLRKANVNLTVTDPPPTITILQHDHGK